MAGLLDGKLLKQLGSNIEMDLEDKIEDEIEEDATNFIEELERIGEEEIIHIIKPKRKNEEKKSKKIIKKIEKEEEILGEFKSKERKRNNRVNANRNDYGNEGFLLMILYYLGCYITLSKLQKDGKHQKLKIVEVGFEDKILLSRKEVEDNIEKIDFPVGTNLKRAKRIITSTNIDNGLLDIIKNFFGFQFKEEVKKKPEKDYMPERRVIESIHLKKEWNKKEIINEGVLFYENIKLFSGKNKTIHLSIDEVTKSLHESLINDSIPPDKSSISNSTQILSLNSCDESDCHSKPI
ncbi:hypothetical protein EHI8A_013610 [Entamoeba histolytica HM-1:IMSS-B]|uniref:Uncharacterized protein n=4 Tax=Entamoeba histolytica TaxID=5759 RepID=C4M0T5_ENTH1|nr:hypothetical protein EHI_100470 [Entamoeba histolytica HM-1:IMSS]EAL49724.1 hypothetical protein EHI_100470 [Entamoeba histolytica HM-1:IMSS]EMH76456.1 hypothetical protein EHI8A_013610 [Entamoeba histolytica HM-1:IMSS-B]ENY65863.1 hypothetical protein EHI7A_037240 [Entamoeba histolytica HM-1:IMSS-A]GAT94809.1 hypothetical protein CL6EHI_100470 [Entamoeba histolytica]|eukprot:XP_655110.1 hypothetical protein EHI_100470 [Entamoeba histolytica HM-1:IMSS]